MSQKQRFLSFRLIVLAWVEAALLAALLFLLLPPATTASLLVSLAAPLLVAFAFTLLIRRLLLSYGSLPESAAPSASASSSHQAQAVPNAAMDQKLEELPPYHLKAEQAGDADDVLWQAADTDDHAKMGQLSRQVEDLETVVTELDRALRRLASGDLTVRIDAPVPEALSGLCADFNHSAKRLEEVLDHIGSSASASHGRQAELQADLKALMQSYSGHAATVASISTELGTLTEAARKRTCDADFLAAAGHNAKLDLSRSRQALDGATNGMRATAEASSRVASLSDEILDIAFRANILAMNVKLQAGKSQQSGPDVSTIGEEFRQLAEHLARIAESNANKSHEASMAATAAADDAGKAVRESEAMAVYLGAMQEKAVSLAASHSSERTALETLRSAVMTLSRSGRQEMAVIDAMSQEADAVSSELAAINREASRFTPVRPVQARNVAKPQPTLSPRPGSHLRLIKS